MKKYKPIIDVVLLFGLTSLVLLSVSTDFFVMPSKLEMIILATVLSLASIFMVMFWREKPEDERELENQALASRSAYLIGACILVITLTVQGIRHKIDPVVAITLLAMIATKVVVQRHKDR